LKAFVLKRGMKNPAAFSLLLSALLLNASACRSVSGYSDLEASLRSTNEVRVRMYTAGAPVEVVPLRDTGKTVELLVGTYKVEIRREENNIRYTTDQRSRMLVANGTTRPTELTIEELERVSPSTPIEWSHSMALGTADHEWTSKGSTWNEHSSIVGLSTTWANVSRVTATEHGSPILKGIGFVGAFGGYLTGAGLIAYQANNWKEQKTVSVPLIGLGAGLIIAGIPFLVLAIKNRSRKVSVYGEEKGHPVR